MENNQIIFKLNDQESITIPLPHDLSELNSFCQDPIYFSGENFHYCISDDYTKEALRHFLKLLTLAAHNKLPLHPSVKKDLGYLFNELYQDKLGNNPDLIYADDLWVGLANHVWSAHGKSPVNVWLYNDAEGRILLTITPHYPWDNQDLQKIKSYEPYQEWITHYKPLLTRVIPVEAAKQWIEQTALILQKIKTNDETMDV